ncbi:MAG: PorP/SprF family type IX secretion system membrane protein [Brumimicrobium sp.]|nr:PorP/SprF family type IX secretion system membrane protein [Brumimicrobium sp.]MCO5267775.1 PorP/SprF family type IX secretion system membrane protein [Brumimicrobium sp.]
MKFIYIIIVLFILCGSNILAQDPHFSAMDYSSQNLSPALVGAKYDVQANINYRNQWSSFSKPFQTVGAAVDARINPKGTKNKGYFAAGINFLSDKAGENNFETNNFGITLGYHIKLADEHILGVGLQFGYGERNFGFGTGQWGNQYNGYAYDSNLPSGESFARSHFGYFDMGSGLSYIFRKEASHDAHHNGFLLNIGFAAYHNNTPAISFMDSKIDPLYTRWVGFLNAEVGLGKSNMALEPLIIIQAQGPFVQTFVGTSFRFYFGDDYSFYNVPSFALGIFYRDLDAMVTRMSVRYKGAEIGAAYDINMLSSLKRSSKSQGAFEIFVRYVLNYKKPSSQKYDD